MDQQAATLLSTLKRPSAQTDVKVNQLNALKSDIKHYRVPETAQSTIFDCIKLAISQQASSTLLSTALSTLGHLIKRLKIQDNSGHAISQLAPRLFPALQERLGDLREPVRASASQAMSDLYPFCPGDVEEIIRDEAISGSSVRAKETGMRWVARMHKDEAMPFKSYTQSIVARLEDADGTVREAAKAVVLELFSNAPNGAKLDLKKQLKAYSVRHTIATQILTGIGAEGTSSRPQTSGNPDRGGTPDMAASTRSLPAPKDLDEILKSEAAQPPPQETVQMDPIYLHSQRELEDIFTDMLPHLEGKETEHNWISRDKAVLKLRRILKGNAPNEYHQTFMAGIKSVIEGILKSANSLRTTMASNGCQLIQELAKTLGPAMDAHVEILLQSFIKMSAATKHIQAENGRITASEIFQNCTYHNQMMRHIWLAEQDKNAQVRQCATGWLTIILKRQASYKSSFESSGGLELAEKCIKKGLDDSNPKVKEGTRATYWMFAKTWPVKAEKIMGALDAKAKAALEKDSHNPNAILHQSVTTVTTASRPGGTASRNALREHMEQQRKAKAGGKLPSRPNSAMADLSPVKNRSTPNGSVRGPSKMSQVTNRQVSAQSNASTGEAPNSAAATKKGSSLMSGPVRRPRRPEITRPQTADPYASRRMLRPATPANDSPIGSPEKSTGASKASIAASSAVRNRAKTAEHANGSPRGSQAKHSPVTSRKPGPSVHESRPSSKGSETARSNRDDDLTMLMPRGVTGRGQFSPGHKRPGLGETRSVDSGIPYMADEDDFTMVVPSLQNQSRAPSPLAYRSPIKAMFDEARNMGKLSPEAQRTISGSDVRHDQSEQGGAGRVGDEVQIYEDPFVEGETDSGAQDDRKVLAELPLNENVRTSSPTHSVGSSNSPGSPPQTSGGRPPPLSSTPQDRTEVTRNRRLLSSGIERIRTKTLDAHGFRRVQDLAKSRGDIWDGGKKYDELMDVLLEYLQTMDQDSKLAQQPSKLAGLKAQALGVLRALMALHHKEATAWHARALVTVLLARKVVDANSHVVSDMQRTADEIVKEANPRTCIDAMLNFMSESSEAAPRMIAMALSILRQLVIRSKSEESTELDAERKARLARATARYLNDTDSEVRKVDVDLASELFDVFEPSKADFWQEFKGVDEGRLGLLTYYIAKKGNRQAGIAAQ
ncbi:Putative armadillo-like helical, CLASP domain, TOG domain-containing protein [Septoria linicola]|uniref:Armadillo-like helical, CLASP domain, TOG domain-containing protein n=1 Tax=Septoria linicola TaxID=215465 RepID=A0A9Q9AIP0_9PEZI|nr:putative armadillo-like helical, CLASP domain, TOG domain-containing protein [Septoria linicola]USW49760.1 Putative armadillo-like helical, CLASP domain, TOG domain-containing protein [Septoria linicola]